MCDWLGTKGITPFVISVGKGTTTDRLFGGTNLKNFIIDERVSNKQDWGKLEYLVEYSLFNHEIVVIEELFDAPDHVLEQLKDTLSSGVFRNGSQIFPIKTKVIIACTNKNRKEFEKNDSLSALMERFPYDVEVKWNNYSTESYKTLLETKLGSADPLLLFILDQYSNKNNKIISPRIAIMAQETITKCGPNCLNYIAEFSKDITLLSSCISKYEGIKKAEVLSKELEDMRKDLSNSVSTNSSFQEIQDVDKRLVLYYAKMSDLKTITVPDEQMPYITNIYGEHKKHYDSVKQDILVLKSLLTDV